MGEVWRARDANLDREVAIKLLNPGALADATTRDRFRREAHVLSRLSHPGVATIYDFDSQAGVDFLVMELVTGGTLESRIAQGALPTADVTRIGAQIADALQDAHARGVLHRDLKPGNIVLTDSGQPKILDFGLALLLGVAAAQGKITQTGMIVGSLPYMAPEQLLGEADGVGTDIYALGVMLFEMTVGRRPFTKERSEALMFEIFNNTAPPVRSLRPELPTELEALIADCLAKDATLRPGSAAAVAESLRAIGSGAHAAVATTSVRSTIRSIAVLPLRNVSRDPAQEYFADGMSEAIISDLARIKALRVISYTSSIKYKATDKSLPEIARELNVDAVLEGSALLLGDRVRVSVQLVSARADETLWADRYDRSLENVLGLISELAETVVREIAVQLTPAEATRLAERAVVDPGAHLEFLKSRHSAIQGTKDALEIAVKHARRALEIDPNFALAWSSLADAHASLGMIASLSGDPVGGIRLLSKAIELNPGLPMAHSLLGRCYYAFERHTEALAVANKSAQLDPLSALMRTSPGDAYYFAREYEKSVFHYRMAIELDPRFDGAHTDLARALEALGRFGDARASYEAGLRVSGGVAGPTFGLAHLEAAAGNEAEARRILAELVAARSVRVVSAWGIGALHASLGDVDDAFHWLEIAIKEKATGLLLLRVHPRLDPIRKDARYWPMVERVGLG